MSDEPYKLPLRKPARVWLVASAAHRREVPASGNYTHICGLDVPDVRPVYGKQPKYNRLACLACEPGAGGPLPLIEWEIGFEEYSTLGTAKTGIEWQWTCPLCRTIGAADSEANAHGLTTLHLRSVCPGTAVIYYGNGDQDCYVNRVARHQNLHRLYLERVPAWEGRFRGDKGMSTGHLPMCDPECREKHTLTAEDLEPLGALAALE